MAGEAFFTLKDTGALRGQKCRQSQPMVVTELWGALSPRVSAVSTEFLCLGMHTVASMPPLLDWEALGETTSLGFPVGLGTQEYRWPKLSSHVPGRLCLWSRALSSWGLLSPVI